MTDGEEPGLRIVDVEAALLPAKPTGKPWLERAAADLQRRELERQKWKSRIIAVVVLSFLGFLGLVGWAMRLPHIGRH